MNPETELQKIEDTNTTVPDHNKPVIPSALELLIAWKPQQKRIKNFRLHDADFTRLLSAVVDAIGEVLACGVDPKIKASLSPQQTLQIHGASADALAFWYGVCDQQLARAGAARKAREKLFRTAQRRADLYCQKRGIGSGQLPTRHQKKRQLGKTKRKRKRG